MAAPVTDLFAVLGLPRRLNLDTADLERRYLALSRETHPDRFATAPAAQRIRVLEASANVNRAYRTLKDGVQRAEHLLVLEGVAPAESGPPRELFARILEVQETVVDFRLAEDDPDEQAILRGRLESARAELRAEYDDLRNDLQQIASRWDALADTPDGGEREALLKRLTDLLGTRRYYERVLTDLDNVLAGAAPVSHGGSS
jgi:molecular chaperone HscB